jgi:hypothetical protein
MSVKNVRFVWDEEFHRLVKAHAAYKGMGMAAFVEACVRAELKEHGIVKPPLANFDLKVQAQAAAEQLGPNPRTHETKTKEPTPFIDEAPTPKPRSFADWKPAPGLSKTEQAGRKK